MLYFFKVENYVQVCVTRWSFGHSFAGEGTPMPPAWLGNIESEKYRCWICKPTKGVFSNPDGFLQGIYTILQKIHRRFQVIHGYSQPSNLARSTSIGKSSNRTRGKAERCASKKLQPLPTLNMDLVESVPWQNVGLIYLELKWGP